MDPFKPITSSITSTSFTFLTSAEVKALSVKQVQNPKLFDNTNVPTSGGLYDPAFGPTTHGDICPTCGLTSFNCPGHFGHIQLPFPVYNPLFMKNCFAVLRASCTNCHRFLATEAAIVRYTAKLILLEHGLLTSAMSVDLFTAAGEEADKEEKKAKRKTGKGEETEEDTGEDIGAVHSSVEMLRSKVATWVDISLRRVIATSQSTSSSDDAPKESYDRDAYKQSGSMVHDERRKLLASFFKESARNRCSHCEAHVHRLKKDGATKIVEFSLTKKQRDFQRARGIKRKNAAFLKRLADKSVGKRRGGEESDEGFVEKGSGSDEDEDMEGKKRKRRFEEDSESEKEEEEDEGYEEGPDSEEEEEGDDEGEDLHAVNDEPASKAIGARKTEKQTERTLLPTEVQSHLRLLFKNEAELCSLIYSPHGPVYTSTASSSTEQDEYVTPFGLAIAGRRLRASADVFFMDVVSTPPSRFRPASTLGTELFENPQNGLLSKILTQTILIRDLNVALSRTTEDALKEQERERQELENEKKERRKGGKGKEKEKEKPMDRTRLEGQLFDAILGLQIAVNSMMDSTKNPMPLKQGKLPPMGVKQILEKKEGLFRKNMMGKRVNYAARSVISPDVNIETNEIGVPPIFAKKLTFPEPVTNHNLKEMQVLVKNGDNYPGASFIQREDGILISLATLTQEEREAHANALQVTDSIERNTGRVTSGVPQTKVSPVPKKVYRHLRDGDVLILNRQPTLHKPSMMCHVAKVLTGEKTIRMHYANCNSYNADFDGDEMNMHFPQNVIAQAEARLIANTDNQYLVPTSGGPIRGLIQDHIVAAVWMTNKETFFTRQEYYQLIYGALRPESDYTGEGRIITLPPTIWKPQKLWTGKQIISTVLRNITPRKFSGLNMSSGTKVEAKYWGPESKEDKFIISDGEHICGILDKAQFGGNGLVHAVYEVFGASVAGKLLSILSRLFTKYLQHRGFSCGVEDLVLQPEAEMKRKKTLGEAHERTLEALYKFVGLDKAKRDTPEFETNLRVRMEEVLRDDRKSAGLDTTISTAMAGLWAEANKHCTGAGLSKLFPRNQMQLMTISGAKGSLVNASQISSSLGQQALEGRRVPTMVSGKTLPSFKAFETRPRAGGFVAQRFLTGIQPQEYYFHCMAGREGLIDTAVKTSRSGYLQRCLIKHLEGIRVHYDHTVRNSDRTILQFNYGEDSLDVTKQKLLYDFEFVAKNYDSLAQFYRPRDLQGRVIDEIAGHYAKSIFKSPDSSSMETALSKFNPTAYLGSTSEKYYAEAQAYIKTNPNKLLKPKKKERGEITEKALAKMIRPSAFQSMLDVRYMRSLVEAGESVGLLASQSVGEPSTQMTLNTFHLSGFGAANVTLGIPRLREIIMTASQTPKTPTMRLFLPPDVQNDQDRLRRFCTKTSALHLSQIIESVVVEERLSDKSQGEDGRTRIYDIHLNFYPEVEYLEEFHIDSETVLSSLHTSFMPIFEADINKELRQRNRESKNSGTTLGKGRPLKAAGGERSADEEDRPIGRKGDDDKDPEDGDADDAKRAAQSRQKVNYDDDDTAAAGSDDEMSVVSAGSAGDQTDAESRAPARAISKNRSKSKLERMRALEGEIVTSSRYKYVSQVQFDKDAGKWCKMQFELGANQPKLLLVGIAEKACSKAVVRAIPGIANCYLIEPENKNEERHLFTEGANIQACWEFAFGTADLTKLMSNDIAAILETYGVEAGRANIIAEMRGIFKAYKIDVDFRHLSLIADYMTSEGGFKPFSRRGIATSSSPFAKASFETTADFLSEAVLHGDFDDLLNPSANIAIGKTMKAGTGTFDLLSSFQKTVKDKKEEFSY